ncbi:MAG: transcriptional regulator, partial [Pseudomonadota bacterium]
RALDDAEAAPLREAAERMLRRHAPYPAFTLDRHWRLGTLNGPAQALFGAAGLSAGDGLAEALAHDPAIQDALENFDEVAAHMAARLRAESAHFGGDARLDDLAATLEAAAPRPADGPGLRPALIPARWRAGGATLSLFSTLAQFGSAEDIALAELRIELMFPADARTRAALEALAAGA